MQTKQAIAEYIVENLPRHELFSLGTIDQVGEPWVVCLSLCYDSEFRIIWKSAKNTEHSKHIAHNPHVSICVYSDGEHGDFGLYTKCLAREVTDPDEINKRTHLRYGSKGRAIPSTSKFIGDGPDRIYVADVTQAWVTDQSHTKLSVDLNVLRDLLVRQENSK